MSNPISALCVTPAYVSASEIILLMSCLGMACCPCLGAHDFGGTVAIEGCMVERRLGIDVECSMIVC